MKVNVLCIALFKMAQTIVDLNAMMALTVLYILATTIVHKSVASFFMYSWYMAIAVALSYFDLKRLFKTTITFRQP